MDMTHTEVIKTAQEKEQQLRSFLRQHSPLVIAYSGGVDSSYLSYVAYQELGQFMLAVLALSASLAKSEEKRAYNFLNTHHIPYRIVSTNEMLDARYVQNDKQRCFYCKTALFQVCAQVTRDLHWQHIAYGYNADDAQDIRPGQIAAEKMNILRPLYACDMSKEDIRLNSQNLGLMDCDRPAQPCLASRLLYGTKVTVDNLKIVETVESALQNLGFTNCRARYDGVTLRIEVLADDIKHVVLSENRKILLNVAQTLGVKFITVDLEGFSSGKLNRMMEQKNNG